MFIASPVLILDPFPARGQDLIWAGKPLMSCVTQNKLLDFLASFLLAYMYIVNPLYAYL